MQYFYQTFFTAVLNLLKSFGTSCALSTYILSISGFKPINSTFLANFDVLMPAVPVKSDFF